MSKILNGGLVRRSEEQRKLAVSVQSVTFDGLRPAEAPGAGDEGVLILANSPRNPYQLGDSLTYQDGNGDNDLNFEVVSVVRSAKYNVQVV